MKYLKLFEQVDEWDDPFGEEMEYLPIKIGDELYYNDGKLMGTITRIKDDEIYFEIPGMISSSVYSAMTLRGMLRSHNIKRKE